MCIYTITIFLLMSFPNRSRFISVKMAANTAMDDPHEVKTKGGYNPWSEPERKMLLRLLVDAINQGFHDANGKFNKLTVETRILSTLNKELGTVKTYQQYKNRMKILKSKYQTFADFLRCSYGFGWDPVMKKFTADDEVWNVYLQANPGNKHLRDESFEDYEDLRMIFGKNIATGQNAVGSGDTINAQSYRLVDDEETTDADFVQMMDDAEGFIDQQPSDHEVFSSVGKRVGEKLPQRKKARTETHSNKVSEMNALTEVSSQLFGMIQKRWEQEAEEKEAEDKANNVWDAIKEIPDLEDDLRYEAMTLVHSLGMESGFMNMSITDRCGWIKRSLRKPSA